MARYRRTIEDALKDMQGQSRTVAGLTLSVPELQELGTEYLGANSVTRDQLAENAVELVHLDVELQNNLSNLNAAMGQLGTSMDEVQQDAIEREQALDQMRDDLTDLDTSLTEIDTSFWPLQNTVSDLTGNVNDLQELTVSHEETMGGLVNDLINAQADIVTIDDSLAQARIDLTDVTTQLSSVTTDVSLVDGKIADAINDSLAIPITEDRLPVGEWTIWPFVQNTIPAGALEPGAIGETDIQDFSLVVKKFKDDRHRIY